MFQAGHGGVDLSTQEAKAQSVVQGLSGPRGWEDGSAGKNICHANMSLSYNLQKLQLTGSNNNFRDSMAGWEVRAENFYKLIGVQRGKQ